MNSAKMAAYGKCLYKKSCDLNCQVFVNAGTNVTPQSVCLACKHLAAFHEQVAVKSEQITANNDTKNSSSKPLQSTVTERSLTSPTNTGGNGTFGKAKSFTEWLKDKRSDEFRQTKQTKKRKINSKERENNDELVTINIGLMESKGNQLKKVWGKRLPIKIQKCSTYSSILETGRLKWSAYYSNLMQDKEYVLLYEDGNQALFMPGGHKEFFDLSKYKEELGRDYRRICLYLCTEEDFDAVWESSHCICTQITEEEVSLSVLKCCWVFLTK